MRRTVAALLEGRPPGNKPDPVDDPFDPEITDTIVDAICTFWPFNRFAESQLQQVKKVLLKHARFLPLEKRDIVIRQDDFGNSAFVILSGDVRVVFKARKGTDPNRDDAPRLELPADVLGRKRSAKKSVFRVVSQLWNVLRRPERLRAARKRAAVAEGEERRLPEKYVDLIEQHAQLNEADKAKQRAGENPTRAKREKRYESVRQSAEQERFLGEIGALTRERRTTTVYVESDRAELVELRWQGLRRLMTLDPTIKADLLVAYRDNATRQFFRTDELFRNLDDETKAALAQQLEFLTFGETDGAHEEVIARGGEYPNGLYIVRAGFSHLLEKRGSGEGTVEYKPAPYNYGIHELIYNYTHPDTAPAPYKYSLKTVGYTHVLFIPTRAMEDLVFQKLKTGSPEVWNELLAKTKDYDPRPDPSSSPNGQSRPRLSAEVMDFIANKRFFNGKHTMLIDMNRCTRCDDCVRACASTHDNNPRFLRHGPMQGHIMVANSCMHCIDPVCMIECPTGAIHREDQSEEVVINPLSCIGCEKCAQNCPYDSIRMALTHDVAGNIKLKATKCDLCVEQWGGPERRPACERACPHDALVRMDMNDLLEVDKWLKR